MKQADLYQKKSEFYLTMSGFGRTATLFLIVLGLISFAAGIFAGEETRTWGSLLFNLFFFFAIALGGLAFGNMQDVIGATWARPVKRLHESFGSFVPWGIGFFVVYLVAVKFNILGAGKVYNWVANPDMLHHFHGKSTWLQVDFMFFRNLFALAVIFFLTRWHLKSTVDRDMALMNGDESTANQLGEEVKNTFRYWSAPILVAYALCFSLLCFDLTMSLAPTWFSTLWGGWSFAIMMQTLFAFTLLVMFFIKDKPAGQLISRQQFHDIGKLMFGFTVFYAYLTYAHVLTYWYGNVPEETSYFFTRLEKPWFYLICAAPIISFFLPFFLLIPKANKWTPAITIPVCVLILVSQWINYMLIVIPEVTDASKWTVPWIELGIFLGFLGLFFTVFFRFASTTPMVGIADPLLLKSLNNSH